MKLSRGQLEASYAHCRRVARRAHSSFYPTFFLLPVEKRRAMEALYAFMRHTDDLGDGPEPAETRREALRRWREALDRALDAAGEGAPLAAGQPVPGCLASPQETLADKQPVAPDAKRGSPVFADAKIGTLTAENLLPALADTVARFQIPPKYLRAVVEGVEMDLDPKHFQTFDQLAVYCRHVASAVGLACIHIWGFRGEEAPRPADQCGIALQLTNILRDVKEDAERGRVYLPLDDLRRCDYTVEDLRRGVVDARFRALVDLELNRAEECYRQGSALFDYLEPDGRRIFGMMTTLYHRLLGEIRRRRDRLFTTRIELGRGQKLRIAARWLLLPPKRDSLP